MRKPKPVWLSFLARLTLNRNEAFDGEVAQQRVEVAFELRGIDFILGDQSLNGIFPRDSLGDQLPEAAGHSAQRKIHAGLETQYHNIAFNLVPKDILANPSLH